MQFTTTGAYARTKKFIDYLNIFLTVVICFIFIAIIFLRSRSGLLFPLEFFLGAVVNGTNAAKKFILYEPVKGGILTAVAVVLLVLCILTLRVTI
ncbi:hypothetical protein [Lachnospira multipara]|uniref:hypothetical protein n=1 Tax=Lachnospira multipara TaxID=28051 RepID=UPI000486362D|nr:hypothetical protein [Lachnospira multipara]